MTLGLICTAIIGLIGAATAVHLSERHSLTSETRERLTSLLRTAGLVGCGVGILLWIFISASSAIAFIAGIAAHLILEYCTHRISSTDAPNQLNDLFVLCGSIIGVSVFRLLSTDTPSIIAFGTGVAVISFIAFVITRSSSPHTRALLVAAVGVLGALYFYAGSERVALFPLALLSVGAAGTLVSIFAATQYSWKTPRQILVVSQIIFLLLSTTVALWLVSFRPIFYIACVALGVACTQLRLRNHGAWVQTTLALAALAGGFFIAQSFGVVVVLVALAAQAGNTALLHEHKQFTALTDFFAILVIFLLFIQSIAVAGRSVLFELGDAYVLIGILLSTLIVWSYSLQSPQLFAAPRKALLLLLSPTALSLLSILLFGKVHGLIVVCSILFGLIIHTLFIDRSDKNLPEFNTLIQVYALTGMLFMPVLFR